MPDLQGEITLKIEADNENIIRISVLDNGLGLPKDNMKQLIEPYVTTKKKGTGLGLAIVKKILEDHNGMISLENWASPDDNKTGACVTVTLPLKG
jgi:two-component system nitrogen regulation sensor histidine kinase NtrY